MSSNGSHGHRRVADRHVVDRHVVSILILYTYVAVVAVCSRGHRLIDSSPPTNSFT